MMLIKKVLTAFVVFLLLVLVACTAKADYSAINAKIEKGEPLTADEYHAVVDYLVDCYDDFGDMIKDGNKLNMDGFVAFIDKYPYLFAFEAAVETAEPGAITERDAARIEKAMPAGAEEAIEEVSLSEPDLLAD